ncbi:hypothetical protein PHYBLDRAFT_67507 [Phycomyces blakesleeanus NRRL 1555(-)]|uniref:Uncharacterized protein n=1 Tax=Phycomyces blakesleeanus (strain ATCC 8743b / DSM 1359 / FGSC 10004 / NBRC 33097 / NRRL 1555) TaxID=763407 RepID=A0A162PVW3_PHYB8|nr:hypothetical protein PHYBLDRAFT_67507 [Phycomyces blakesleeanus NRRL 1555(-)]OAD74576.1 hypothetical protein PHYBLDRAFT_67507 [Phycomyces blakesleeanus NRRL 1555(-)]|eukprot:XP_018292616.1 hypothetical protein PHYBLDRAFT_67507 [Phycomyces blakesleeanus NRRL 1555(-)]
MLDAENIPFDEMLLNFCVCENIPFDSKVLIVNRVEYTVAGNHQTVKKNRGRDEIDIISKEITLDMSLKLSISNIQVMFDYQDYCLALVKEKQVLDEDKKSRGTPEGSLGVCPGSRLGKNIDVSYMPIYRHKSLQ